MNFSSWSSFLDLLRAGVFLLISFEAYFLTRLYRMAHKEMKNTPIIHALELLFASISFLFVILTLVALLNPFESAYRDISKDILVIPSILLLGTLTKFREKSLDNEIAKIKKV